MSTFKEKYFEIINNRKAHPLADGVFGEMHHIIPRSLGGSDDEENLVKLTAQEHYDCHELLPFMYLEEGDTNGYQKMMYAWNQISHTREGIVINAEQYAELRERFAIMMKGPNNGMYGKQHSDETKKKIGEANSKALKGKKHSDETKKKIGEARKGKKHSYTSKQKMSEAKKGKNHPRYNPFIIDNIQYDTTYEAAKHFNVSHTTISNWLNDKTKTDHICNYVTKEQ